MAEQGADLLRSLNSAFVTAGQTRHSARELAPPSGTLLLLRIAYGSVNLSENLQRFERETSGKFSMEICIAIAISIALLQHIMHDIAFHAINRF